MRGCGVARVEGDGSGQWSSGAGRDEVRQILDESGGRLRGRLDIFLRGGDLREGLVELSGSRGFAGVRRGDDVLLRGESGGELGSRVMLGEPGASENEERDDRGGEEDQREMFAERGERGGE